MDPFAQSRADDDLFADEFEPVEESTPEPSPAVPQEQATTIAQPSIPTGPARSSNHNGNPKARQDRRGRGGRGGRGGAYQNGMSNSRFATPQAEITTPTPPAPEPVKPASTSAPAPAAVSETTETAVEDASSSEPKPETPPAQPQPQTQTQPDPPRITAVRGDRSATGGPAHKKLTEAELSAKMAQMAIINAKRAESHRASEADQAAFQHREKELEKERKEKAVAERKNERVMEMERAKNRERKMKAQGGREWDSEKKEEDMVDRKGRTSEFVRGGFGGVRGGGLAGSRYATQEPDEGERETRTNEGRGRGRGRGGRGGAGRGGKAPVQAVPTEEDFPALASPSATAPVAGGDWAEEMATPIEEKKMDM